MRDDGVDCAGTINNESQGGDHSVHENASGCSDDHSYGNLRMTAREYEHTCLTRPAVLDPEGRGERDSRTESEEGSANAVWKSQGLTESPRSMFRLVEGKRDSRKESGHKSKAQQNRRKCPSPFAKQAKMIRHNQSPWSSPSKTG